MSELFYRKGDVVMVRCEVGVDSEPGDAAVYCKFDGLHHLTTISADAVSLLYPNFRVGDTVRFGVGVASDLLGQIVAIHNGCAWINHGGKHFTILLGDILLVPPVPPVD